MDVPISGIMLFFSYKLHFGKEFLGIYDLFITPVYLFLIYAWTKVIAYRNQNNPEYKYFFSAIWTKLLATIFFCIFYIVYYGGGDTTAYFSGSYILIEMFLKRPLDFFTVYFGEQNFHNRLLFGYDTNWPGYWDDPRAFFITKLITRTEIHFDVTYIYNLLIYRHMEIVLDFLQKISQCSTGNSYSYFVLSICFVLGFWDSQRFCNTFSFGLVYICTEQYNGKKQK